MPRTVLSRLPFDYTYVERHFSTYPIIVKMASGSRGDAVWKVDNRHELMMLVTMSRYYAPALVKYWKKGKDSMPPLPLPAAAEKAADAPTTTTTTTTTTTAATPTTTAASPPPASTTTTDAASSTSSSSSTSTTEAATST